VAPPRAHLLLPSIASAGVVLGALVSVGATGCGVECVGVGCADEYGASRVAVHFSDQLTEAGSHNPRRADARIIGDSDAGVDWSVQAVGGQLWVGMPELSQVRAFSVQPDDALEHTDWSGAFRSEVKADRLGSGVQILGDADGDGVLDVAVSAPGRTATDLGREAGAVLLVPITELDGGMSLLEGGRVRIIEGPQAGGQFGEAMAPCPDIDGDGLPELLVGAPWLDDRYTSARTVHLTGGASLILSTEYPDTGPTGWNAKGSQLWTGASNGARAGTAVACADLIGDSTADLIIGAPFADGEHEGEGAIYIIDGATRLEGELSLVADRILSGGIENAWLGWSLSTGDLDGDGRADLIAGAPGHITTPGPDVSRPQGLALVWDGQDLHDGVHDAPRVRVTGEDEGDSLGRTVSTADIDNDGDHDLLVGAPRRIVNDAFDAGALYIFTGAPGHAGLRPQVSPDDAHAWWEAARPYFQTGGTFTVGDVDSDGQPDLVLVHRRQPG